MTHTIKLTLLACALVLASCASDKGASDKNASEAAKGDAATASSANGDPTEVTKDSGSAASQPPSAESDDPIALKAAIDRGTAAQRPALTATGYAVISVQNAKTPAQQRLLAIRAAKLDAYRGLAEQVYGIYLDSNTTVADLVVKSDAFRTRVEGVVHGAQLGTITPVNNETYEVTVTLDRSTVGDLRRLYLDYLGRKAR